MTENGPIDVNGNITPITKQPVESIDAAAWPKMNNSELLDQRMALQNRLNIVQSSFGHPDTIMQMQRGLQHLDQIIQANSYNTRASTTGHVSGKFDGLI